MKEEKTLNEMAEEIYQKRNKKIRENNPDRTEEYIKCILEIFSAIENSPSDNMIFCLGIGCFGRHLRAKIMLSVTDFKWLEAEDFSSPIRETVERFDNLVGDINTLSRLSEELNKLPHIDANLVGENSNKLFIRLVDWLRRCSCEFMGERRNWEQVKLDPIFFCLIW